MSRHPFLVRLTQKNKKDSFTTSKIMNYLKSNVIHPEGLFQATVIRNVLPLCHLAIDVLVFELLDLVTRVLIYHALSPLTKCLDRRVIPPLHQVTVFVELASLVIETVCDLVTNDNPNATVIQRLGKVLIVKRRLQNASWENLRENKFKLL